MTVDAIYDLATGSSRKFRTVIGRMGNELVARRQSMPIGEYLTSIAARFA